MIVDFPDEILFNENITSTGKLLCLLMLENTKTNETEFCNLSHKQYSEMLGMDHLGITKALKKLEADGYVEKREVMSVKNTKKFEYKVKE